MKKLAVIVPYRDREHHLKEFVSHMEKMFNDEEIPFEIAIVEQADDLPFNRAKLLNIGFKELENCDYFAFHDVDMLPIDSDYGYPEGPTHLASEVEQFNWGLPYDGYFGGVTLFDKDSFLLINGYSNEYWGWGAEDDDVLHRCVSKGIETFRKDCKYKSLGHERNIERIPYLKNVAKLQNFQKLIDPSQEILKDGLSTLKYEFLEEMIISKHTKLIKVKL
jgi:hypothetical protein